MRRRRIDISQVADRTNSRERGKAAAEKILNLEPPSDAIDLEFQNDRVLTRSFLDGIVLSLGERGVLDLVTFVTRDAATLGKLERVVRHRRARVFVSETSGGTRTVVRPAAPLILEEEGDLSAS